MNATLATIKTILLAEDDPRDVELTLEALGDYHLANKVEVVSDGEKALQYLYCQGAYTAREGGNPVLVLLDLKMPKVDGLAVLRVIKDDENLRAIPVVMLSSSREKTDLKECYSLGVNAYVVKPVDFSEFMTALKNVGIFWAVVNEPPPESVREVIESGAASSAPGQREP